MQPGRVVRSSFPRMKSPRHLAGTLATLVLAGMLAGCASIGAPVPPALELPKPPTDLRAVRKGNKVYLFWSVPTMTTDRQNVRRPGPTRICRSLAAAMSECDTPVGNLPPAAPSEAQGAPSRKSPQNAKPPAEFVDTLPTELQQQSPAKMVTYAVQPLNLNARAAGFSNQVQVPLAPTLPPPVNFQAQVTAEGVVLTWDCETPPAESSALRYLYRIYRRKTDDGSDAKLADVKCEGGRFDDITVEWQKSYEYRIAAVTEATLEKGVLPCSRNKSDDGVTVFPDCIQVAIVEGDDTPIREVFTNDIYPPGVPTGLQAVFSGAGQPSFIDLVWAPDTAADLAGYNVYRREDAGPATKLNTQLVKAPAYRDPNVTAGKTYLYSITAVDLRGNESTHSEEASEAVPPS
jgi:hypothetical protein